MWLKCNEMSADPSLHDVLSHDIKQHFKEHPEIDQHNKCNRVLKLQNMMGWDQLLKGRISEWLEISVNKKSKHKQDTNNKHNGLQLCVWKWFLQEWKDRNEATHGVDAIAKVVKEQEKARCKAHSLCTMKDKIMPAH